MSSDNLYATGEYPFVQWQPSEPGSVQHTDQEYTDSNGSSYLFRMYNAEYDPLGSNWKTLPGGGSDAYATVQNPDGSIHYYTNPSGETSWTTWVGSDNNTIYNAEDFGLSTDDPSGGADNAAALVSLFTALSNPAGSPGGSVRIPQYDYPVIGTPTGIEVPDQTILQALGTGGAAHGGFGPYYHFSIADSGGSASALFYADSDGGHTSGGVEFRDLAFFWNNAEYPRDTAINMGFYGGLVYRCTFTNIPTAINFGGYTGPGETGNALGAAMVEGFVEYEQGPDGATAIVMAGQHLALKGPIILFQADPNKDDNPQNCTAIAIGGGSATSGAQNAHNVIDGVRFDSWTTGIDYADMNGAIAYGDHSGCVYTVITNCEFACNNTCINMVPSSNDASLQPIIGQKIIGNTLAKSHNSKTPNPVVYIDTNRGPNTNVQSVDLIGNLIASTVSNEGDYSGVAQDNQYGVQINAGDSIRIIGGKISNFGTKGGDDGTANVCISGNPGSVIIDGVDLGATYAFAPGGSTGATASQYALLISGALSAGPVQLRNCDMGGFSGPPVGVTGSIIVDPSTPPGRGPLYITDCAGYNDQNSILNTLPHITTGTAYAAYNQGANGGTSYYGPSFVMFTAANLAGGSFQYNGGAPQILTPGQVVCLTLHSPYDTIQFNTHAPAAFTWVGN